MYRPRHFRWKLMHLFNMLAHLGLVVAVATSYIYDLSMTTQSISRGRLPATDVSISACSPASLARVESGFTFDMATHTLLKACLIAGTLGLTVNIALLILLLAVEPNRITLTESEQHWRKQVVTVFGCVVNVLLAGAGIGLGLTLSIKAAHSKPLIAPLILASIQAPLAFCTAVFDAVKNYREGQDLLD